MADNSLNVNLPGVAGGGLNINYNFGGNGDTIAAGAYGFLNNAMSVDNQFLGGSISGTQTFLANQQAPIIAAVSNNVNTYTGIMPQLFKNLFTAFNSTNELMRQGIASTENVQYELGNASISASRDVGKKSGKGMFGCFITTAVCSHMGLPDDCEYLTILRAFRDDFMLAEPARAAMVHEYYDFAPAIVEDISRLPAGEQNAIYSDMREYFIEPAVKAITQGANDVALMLYVCLFEFAKQKATH
jgi:hypothetical protein